MLRQAARQLQRSAALLLTTAQEGSSTASATWAEATGTWAEATSTWAAATGTWAAATGTWAAAARNAARGTSQRSTYSSWHQTVRRVYVDSRGYEHFGRQAGGGGGGGGGRGGNLVIYGVAALGAGCAYYWSCREEVPYTGRRHSLMFTSHRQEEYLGQQIFSQVKAEANAEGKLLPPNHPSVQLVRRIGMKIAAVAGDDFGGGDYKHMQNLDWDFAVVREDSVNAFVVPGGKVVVFTGLLELMATDDELAAVLAHEVAHVLARHQAERISSMSVFSLFQMLLYVSLGISVPGFLYQLAFFLPYSRRAETEADVIGLHLMARACYDPTGNPRMLKKLHAMEEEMQRKMGVAVPQFLRTHPLSKERAREVEKHMPQAIKELQENGDCHHHTHYLSGRWG